MIFRAPLTAACLLVVAVAGCTSATKAAHDSGGPGAAAVTSSGATPSVGSGAVGGTTSSVGSRAPFGSSGASTTQRAPAGVPTSLSALPTVPGAVGGSTPPLTPSARLTCPSDVKISAAFGAAYSGNQKDLDPSAASVVCSYASSGASPTALTISTAEDGHAGYVGKAANMRAVAGTSGSVQPVLGLGDEAAVDMEHDGSSTWAAQLLVRFGPRTVLVVCNDHISTLQRLAQVAELMY